MKLHLYELQARSRRGGSVFSPETRSPCRYNPSKYPHQDAMSLEALFQLMRFNILSTAINSGEAWPIDSADVYAWQCRVYPCFSGAKWHEPFRGLFDVSEEEVRELYQLLNEGNRMSFNEVEVATGVLGSARSTSNWTRSKLIRVCRYMYLCGEEMFEPSFWDALLENGECPTGAQSIARPLTGSDIRLT